MEKLFLLRYDTEGNREDMQGFFEKAIEVHRKDGIPATFFCTGKAIDVREEEFRAFNAAVKGDRLFDLQDHSYTHIGVGYEAGNPVDVLKADYEKSFNAHKRVLGKRPMGVSVCGVGDSGDRLPGFDATEKATAEFEMLVELGMRMINAKLTGFSESRTFCNYEKLGHPEIMGFPSGHSDTEWLHRKAFGDPMEYVFGLIDERAEKGEHLPLMLHDWCAFNFWEDKNLSHVPRIAEHARKRGFRMVTHLDCYEDGSLWK